MRRDDFMRYDVKMNFPHYPQSYPQKSSAQPPIFMVFGGQMWITAAKFQLIHSVLPPMIRFVHNLSRALSTKNVKFSCQACSNFVINRRFNA